MMKKIAYMHMPARNFLTSLASTTVLSAEISEAQWRGKSAIKRAAIIPCSRCSGGPSVRAAMDEANLRVALSRGNCANSAASCHGSRSNRANAESTLSGVLFRSSQTRANRKTLNSDPTTEIEPEPVIFTAEMCVACIGRAHMFGRLLKEICIILLRSAEIGSFSLPLAILARPEICAACPGFDATLIGVTALAIRNAKVQSRILQLRGHASRTRA